MAVVVCEHVAITPKPDGDPDMTTVPPTDAAHAPDAARDADDNPTPVAEIVTFRLRPDVSEVAFLEAARATDAFLTASGEMITRTLSVDADGLWTDHIVWTSMTAAKSTAAAALQDPRFGPFMAQIDPAGMTLCHAPVRLRMDAHGSCMAR